MTSMVDERGRAGAFSRGAREETPRKKEPMPEVPDVRHLHRSFKIVECDDAAQLGLPCTHYSFWTTPDRSRRLSAMR